jgi:RNA polymerase sigma-70 factor, ECF subfamily
MESDGELVTAILDGRREVFVDLVRRYEGAARSVALAVVGNEHAAQDVTQEAFVAAYVKLRRLKDPSAFGGWLLQIVRRQALEALRSERPMQSLDGVDPPASPHRNGELDEGSRTLLAAVGRLPEQERIVVALNYFSGQPVSVIAEMTGRPIGTVTGRLTRARARLRAWLQEDRP